MKYILVFYLLSTTLLYSQVEKTILSKDMKIGVERLQDKLGIPWGFDFISKNELLVTDRRGKLYYVNLKTKTRRSIKGLPPIHASGQGGLLDLKLHPQFNSNQLVYFTYSSRDKNGSTTALGKAQFTQGKLKNFQQVFRAQPSLQSDFHYGSRIVFDRKGYLYMTVGDRGSRHDAQSLKHHNGKLLRLHEDGSIPKDNPFSSAIWTYGHRNPQGLAIHPTTGQLWEHEHGPRGGDEINLIKPSLNYGWPEITWGREYHGPKIGKKSKKGMVQAVHYYVPSIAPSGLLIYSGKVFKKWQHHFFLGALAKTHINKVSFSRKPGSPPTEVRLLNDWGKRIRNIAEGPDGLIYFSTDQGVLYRLRPL